MRRADGHADRHGRLVLATGRNRSLFLGGVGGGDHVASAGNFRWHKRVRDVFCVLYFVRACDWCDAWGESHVSRDAEVVIKEKGVLV